MCKEQKFFICKHCGNLVGTIHHSGAKMICCGEPMTEIMANTVEASVEKHLPVVQVEGNVVTVHIGSVPHPMTSEHHIPWVYIQTKQGGQRKCLAVDTEPTVTFAITPEDEVLSVYAYCNLHGLWKTTL